ncbi:ZDHHC [Mytilus edulis]|uniref:ZDHHC n=1 Tax=Mytilus edulis TaxID=6550 RepID=A0A8S3QFT3_MYTED|nr:ZDHHC [Mytilus edulis]
MDQYYKIMDQYYRIMDQYYRIMDQYYKIMDQYYRIKNQYYRIMDQYYRINGPTLQNNGPILQNNGPTLQNKEPILQNNGPILQNNGPILQNNGPILQNNGPTLQNKGPILQNNGPIVSEITATEGKQDISSNCQLIPDLYTQILHQFAEQQGKLFYIHIHELIIIMITQEAIQNNVGISKTTQYSEFSDRIKVKNIPFLGRLHIVRDRFVFLSVMCIISLFKASTTNPGSVPLVEDSQIDINHWEVCKHVDKNAPKRAHHCRRCNQCVKNGSSLSLESFFIKHQIWFVYLVTALGAAMGALMGGQVIVQHTNILLVSVFDNFC